MSTVTVTLRSLGWSVHVPGALYALGQGAIAPVVVSSAVDLGASLGVAGLLVGTIGVGRIAGDVPSGWLLGRIGERRAMLLATAAVIPALLACVVAPSLWVLGLGVFGTGVCGAMWSLARQEYVTDVVPYALRARAMSTLAGAYRIGMLLGPFAGAAATGVVGTDGAYWVNVVAALLAAAAVAFIPDIRSSRVPAPSTRTRTADRPAPAVGVFRQNLPVLRTLGVAVALASALRASRHAVIPIWGIHLGLDATTISIIFGLSALVDVALFYPGGKLMDSLGRRWVIVPSMLLLGAAFALLPLAHGPVGLTAVALFMGMAQGTMAGINMTLGADVAPSSGRPQFLGVWRLFSDVGEGAGPLALGALIVVLSPTAAVVSIGVLGLVTSWSMNRWIPRRGKHGAAPVPPRRRGS